jgi:hypothetical protein
MPTDGAITMLGGSHWRAGAFGRGVVGMRIAGYAVAVDVVKAMGGSVTGADIGCAVTVIAGFRVREEGLGHGCCFTTTISVIPCR